MRLPYQTIFIILINPNISVFLQQFFYKINNDIQRVKRFFSGFFQIPATPHLIIGTDGSEK